jgi:hypothetical protein
VKIAFRAVRLVRNDVSAITCRRLIRERLC